MTTTFETARIGDKVWHIDRGWGEILFLTDGATYPIEVGFTNDSPLSFTAGGKRLITHKCQTLFWDEIEIEAPQKPLPDLEVDTKVLVWNGSKHHAVKAHFCCFQDGKVFTYKDGRTSYTYKNSDISPQCLDGWINWELAE